MVLMIILLICIVIACIMLIPVISAYMKSGKNSKVLAAGLKKPQGIVGCVCAAIVLLGALFI